MESGWVVAWGKVPPPPVLQCELMAPFEEWLQPLNASQRKLVALYAARQQRLTTELELARQP